MVGWGGVQSHFRVKPNSVEVVLRLSWGCDNIKIKFINRIMKVLSNPSIKVFIGFNNQNKHIFKD